MNIRNIKKIGLQKNKSQKYVEESTKNKVRIYL